MKKWVSILGESYIAPHHADGGSPPAVAIPFVKKTDDRMEGTYSAANHATLPYLVTLAGKRSRLVELRGLVVHGIRWTVRAQVMRDSFHVKVVTHDIHTSTFAPAPFDYPPPPVRLQPINTASITIRIVFDVPGDSDTPGTNIGHLVTSTAPYVRENNGNGRFEWSNIPAKWKWDETSDSYPFAYIEDYVPKNMIVEPAKGYAIGTHREEVLAVSMPFGLVRNTGDVLDVGQFGGGVGALINLPADAAGYVQFTKLDLLVSEKPTWDATGPSTLTVGAAEDKSITITCKYPDGNEPVVGLKVRLADATNSVSFRTAAGQWVHNGVFTTNSQGKIVAKLRADKAGAAIVTIRDGGNTPNMTYIFSPRLKGEASVLVYAAPPPPDQPPPPDTPPNDPRVCTIVPAVPGSPAVPPQVIREDIVGWNSGAVSVDSSTGTADLQFSMDTASIGAVIGLTQESEVTGPAGLLVGFFFSVNRYGAPQYRFVEGGKAKGTDEVYTLGDTFRLTFAAGVARYYVNDVRVRSTPLDIGSEPDLFVGGGLYTSGDTLPDNGDGGDNGGGGGEVTLVYARTEGPSGGGLHIYSDQWQGGEDLFEATTVGAIAYYEVLDTDVEQWESNIGGEPIVVDLAQYERIDGAIDLYDWASNGSVWRIDTANIPAGYYILELVVDGAAPQYAAARAFPPG